MRKKLLLMMVVTTVLAVSAAACTPSAPGEGPPSELAAGFALGGAPVAARDHRSGSDRRLILHHPHLRARLAGTSAPRA